MKRRFAFSSKTGVLFALFLLPVLLGTFPSMGKSGAVLFGFYFSLSLLAFFIMSHINGARPPINQEYAEETRQKNAILDAMPDLVLIFSLDGKPLYVNRAGRTMLGIGEEEDLRLLEIGTFFDAAMKEIIFNEAIPTAYMQGFWQGEAAFTRRDGCVVPVQQTVISHPGVDGKPAYLSAIARDITEKQFYDEVLQQQIQAVQESRSEMEIQQWQLCQTNLALSEANAQLQALATTDGLTGLKNHRTFQEQLTDEFERSTRFQVPLSLVLLDVDRFKSFNDTFGHPAGDTVLKLVAAILQEETRTIDFVGRYGGEEFVLILPGTDADEAKILAERLRVAIETVAWELRPVTASFGIATLSADCPNAALLISEADRALYYAKQRGRNRVFHSEDIQDDAAQKLEMVQTEGGISHEAQLSLLLLRAHDSTVESWSRLLNLRDKETEGHSERVTEMTTRLARMIGLSDQETLYARWGALLHDIGKLGIPDSILLKPGALTAEEWEVMRRHPGIAYEMLSAIEFLRSALDIPYCHHEKWDGTGYPQGLCGEEIPLSARLFAVIDVWDALRSDRPYRKGWSKARTIAHLRAHAGTHFDPAAVRAFLKMVRQESQAAKQAAAEPQVEEQTEWRLAA